MGKMIISNNVSSVLKSYMDNKPVSNAAKEKAAVRRPGAKDEIILSTQAQSFSQLLQKAKNDAGVRQDRIDDIVRRMDAGQYEIDARLVAEKMLSARY